MSNWTSLQTSYIVLECLNLLSFKALPSHQAKLNSGTFNFLLYVISNAY